MCMHEDLDGICGSEKNLVACKHCEQPICPTCASDDGAYCMAKIP